jgi:hypothetical protein
MAGFPLRSAAAIGLLALTFAAPARAQSTTWLENGQITNAGGDRQSYYDSNRAAYDQGFRAGAKQGERDARRSERVRVEDQKTYQRADKGYRREFGSLEQYRLSFRDGYTAGYSAGYQKGSAALSR